MGHVGLFAMEPGSGAPLPSTHNVAVGGVTYHARSEALMVRLINFVAFLTTECENLERMEST
jgi:hypothetical protein